MRIEMTTEEVVELREDLHAQDEREIVGNARHPSIEGVEVNPWRYVEHAQAAQARGDHTKALYLIGLAQGVTETLRAMVPVNVNRRESRAHSEVLRIAADIRLKEIQAR